MMWNHILNLISELISEFSTPSSWRYAINGARDNSALQTVQLSSEGAEFTVLKGETELTLLFKIENSRVVAYINGESDQSVRATISLRHQILRPFIFAFEARNVKIGDASFRFRFETPA